MKTLLFILAYAVAIASISSMYLTVFRPAKVGIGRSANFGTALFFAAIIIVAVVLIVKLHLE